MNALQSKCFIIDTNVIIHDPHVLKNLGSNNIVIPMPVLEEVDNLKKGRTDKARAAREFSRQLDDIRQKTKDTLQEGVDVKHGGNDIHVMVWSAYPQELKNDYYLSSEKMDNAILFISKDIQNQYCDMHVELITKDINMRIKADSIGLCSSDYRNSLVRVDDHYDDFKEFELNDSDSATLFGNGEELLTIPASIDHQIHCKQIFRVRDSNDKTFLLKKESHGVASHIWKSDKIFGIVPRNEEQIALMNILMDNEVRCVAAVGKAGTGKTLVSLACALEQVVELQRYKKVLVARPAYPSGNDLGFLPGSLTEKLDQWMVPFYDNLDYLFRDRNKDKRNGKDIFKELQDFGQLESQALSYIRGRNIEDTIVIIDESQNLTPHMVKTIVTRLGENSKIVLTGDPSQIDDPYLDLQSNGLTHLIDKMRDVDLFSYVTLHQAERSNLADIAATRL